MPKSIEITPDRFQSASNLSMPTIPAYAYDRPISEELESRGSTALVNALKHMMILREFETMLNAIRSKGEHNGVACSYRGPAHLSVGQEAAAVGAAMALSPDDHIFGNHRSHSDFLAKGLAAIESLKQGKWIELK